MTSHMHTLTTNQQAFTHILTTNQPNNHPPAMKRVSTRRPCTSTRPLCTGPCKKVKKDRGTG